MLEVTVIILRIEANYSAVDEDDRIVVRVFANDAESEIAVILGPYGFGSPVYSVAVRLLDGAIPCLHIDVQGGTVGHVYHFIDVECAAVQEYQVHNGSGDDFDPIESLLNVLYVIVDST